MNMSISIIHRFVLIRFGKQCHVTDWLLMQEFLLIPLNKVVCSGKLQFFLQGKI